MPGGGQRVRLEGAEIHRRDEAVLVKTDVRCRSLAPTGKTPVVPRASAQPVTSSP